VDLGLEAAVDRATVGDLEQPLALIVVQSARQLQLALDVVKDIGSAPGRFRVRSGL
jgi:hypothetical protein